MLIEKYLNDTLSTRSKADSARIAAANLMPAYFKRLQQKEDSLRARQWFKITQDSSYLKRITRSTHPNKPLPVQPEKKGRAIAWLPDERKRHGVEAGSIR